MDSGTFVILAPGFPKDEMDTTCLPFPQLFVKTLKKENPSLDIIVLAFQYPFSNMPYEWHGVTVFPFNGKDKGKISRLLLWRKVWKQLKMINNENKVSGILSLWLGECALVGKYASKKFGVRWFAWLMGQDAKKNNRYFSFIKPDSQNLIALSDFLAAELYNNYRTHAEHIIPPGIEVTEFNNPGQQRSIDIIGAGSLIPLKRYEVFIRVIKEVAKNHPRVKAVICGNGPEKSKLVELILLAGLHENIALVGQKDHNEVLALMQQSKILLHPSSYEGFATVYSEALYAGAHVVGFCKPMDTVFEHQHAVESEADMVCEVEKILADRDTDHSPILTRSITETCRNILSLYN